MIYRVSTVFVTTLILLCSAGNALAQEVSADSLVLLANRAYANSDPDSAEVLYNRALARNPEHALAAVGLGRIAVDRDEFDRADHLFTLAETWEPRKGHRQYGEGLVSRKRGDNNQAKAKFQEAYRRNRSHADALIEIAKIQMSGLVEKFAAKRTLRRAVQADSLHPSAYYELGRALELEGDIAGAVDAYEKQLLVNPTSGITLMNLGFALLDEGRYWHARQRLFDALARTSGHELELSLALAASYVGDRQYDQAHNTYVQAMQIMSEEELALYEDITEIATPAEARYIARISGEQRLLFLQKFWLRRDPTPATVTNERMLEHFRRVWYARRHFSEGNQPFDDRGKVYIRYGEPDHRSTSRQPSMITDSDIDAIRDRNLQAIYGANVPDVLTRTPLPAYPLVNPNEYSANLDQGQFLDNWFTWHTATKEDYNTDDTYFDPSVPMQSEAPQFGIESGFASLTRWEEWTYTYVTNGLQVAFVDRIGNGDYRFATPPHTNDLNMAAKLAQYAPAEQYDVAKRIEPDQYYYNRTQDPLNFYYYTAQFRMPDNATELDVYYGLPMSELTFQLDFSGGYTSRVASGIAVFDTLWNVMARYSLPMKLTAPEMPSQARGDIHVDQHAPLIIDGGKRILLSVQAEDVATGRLQAYQENLQIARFDSTTLAMSDVVLAGDIREVGPDAQGKFIRDGLRIVPMASLMFRRNQPMHVYFEIYNLTRGTDYGETEYEVEHAIRVAGRGGGSILGSVGRILGGSGRSVGIGQVVGGIRDMERQHFEINTSNLQSGEYTLIVTVRDMKSGQQVTKTRSFYVGEN